MNEKYRSKGLEIIMATDKDPVDRLETFIAEKDLHLGIARVADVYNLVKANGYPTTYGIDVDGRVIWKGHPSAINDALVERWLTGMRQPRLPRDLCRELGGAVGHYNDGKFGKSLDEAREKLDKAKADEEQVKTDAQYLIDLLDGRMTMLKAAAAKHEQAGYHDRRLDVLEQAADEFAGTDFADDCEKDARLLKRSRDYKRCVDARDALEKLREKLERMEPEKALEALEDFIKEHRRTPYATEAEALAEKIRKQQAEANPDGDDGSRRR